MFPPNARSAAGDRGRLTASTSCLLAEIEIRTRHDKSGLARSRDWAALGAQQREQRLIERATGRDS
jgi:hypothetical protein